MPTAVQFRGIANVCKAFENIDCNAWAVWSGKQLLFSCVAANAVEASAELNNLLEALDKSGSCVYTLKVYEDLKEGTKIKEKTEADKSFNFRLHDYGEEPATGRMNGIYEEIKSLRAENQTLKEELENLPDDEDESMLGRIGNMLLEDPAKLPLMLQSLQSVIGMFIKQTTPTGQPVAIGAVPGKETLNGGPIANAIETLLKYDPQLAEHLTKLAQLAVKDPGTFKFLLSTLDNM